MAMKPYIAGGLSKNAGATVHPKTKASPYRFSILQRTNIKKRIRVHNSTADLFTLHLVQEIVSGERFFGGDDFKIVSP
jgi:hypothetical protein